MDLIVKLHQAILVCAYMTVSIVVIISLACGAFAYPLAWYYNNSMPALFGAPNIGIWQAWSMLSLAFCVPAVTFKIYEVVKDF